jgi:hypothetical protein
MLTVAYSGSPLLHNPIVGERVITDHETVVRSVCGVFGIGRVKDRGREDTCATCRAMRGIAPGKKGKAVLAREARK